MASPSEILLKKFPHQPTDDQLRLFELMNDFVSSSSTRATLIIKGYAGTGKTSSLKAMVQMLPFFDYKSLLLAPTGRAAKVMSAYTNKAAFTIHKMIFKTAVDRDSGKWRFKRQKNYHKRTVFIVDEASMLSNQKEYGQVSLLESLLEFVFEHPDNKLVFIGDTAQLPPVGIDKSVALQPEYLMQNFQLSLKDITLRSVMRQQLDSGILYNATKLRQLIDTKGTNLALETNSFPDVFKMSSERLEDGLRYVYDKFGQGQSVIVCRSNFAANQYNQLIRRSIFFYQDEIEAGDQLMVVRNNYLYQMETSSGFLANGDFVEIMKIRHFEERYGFRFATLELQLTDYPDEEKFEALVLLDTLHTKTASLEPEQSTKLYRAVAADYQDITNPKLLAAALKEDPYLNALQVKFSYALTCHKSQGGQWQAVFVDQGFLKEAKTDLEYLRWLYTAVTRATQELFLVNFSPEFLAD
ncbi:MAG: ATP-dependent DNA helicase [Cyclobacteriaceae bacterium]